MFSFTGTTPDIVAGSLRGTVSQPFHFDGPLERRMIGQGLESPILEATGAHATTLNPHALSRVNS